jgi:hypothetical protein
VQFREELRKTQLLQYLHRVDRAVTRYLACETAPLVIAAEPEILGHYRKLTSYRHVQAEALEANPFAFDLVELHRRASALVEPPPGMEARWLKVCCGFPLRGLTPGAHRKTKRDEASPGGYPGGNRTCADPAEGLEGSTRRRTGSA